MGVWLHQSGHNDALIRYGARIEAAVLDNKLCPLLCIQPVIWNFTIRPGIVLASFI